jgi:hypothetical protein
MTFRRRKAFGVWNPSETSRDRDRFPATQVLRPALSDRLGGALFIGTPHGRNHFWNVYEAAQNQPHWATFQFTTEQGGNVSREELESATHELDEHTYRQEFQASFENQEGVRLDQLAVLVKSLGDSQGLWCK